MLRFEASLMPGSSDFIRAFILLTLMRMEINANAKARLVSMGMAALRAGAGRYFVIDVSMTPVPINNSIVTNLLFILYAVKNRSIISFNEDLGSCAIEAVQLVSVGRS